MAGKSERERQRPSKRKEGGTHNYGGAQLRFKTMIFVRERGQETKKDSPGTMNLKSN